jgi:dipeptidyl aminopeptidase/acylaminoacyl peptidase
MEVLFKVALYYLLGSGIAGAVMGGGFATNLEGRPDKHELQELETIGRIIPLALDKIEGELIAAPNERRPTIIYVHGRSANRTELLPLARALFSEGYNGVLWDATGRQITYGPREIENVLKIVASVRLDPHVQSDAVYVLGFSLGGAMAIGAAAADTEHHIRGIVADSAYADLEAVASRYVTAFGAIPGAVAWPAKTVTFATAEALHGIDFATRNPAEWARRVSCPVFLIHGTSDVRIPSRHSEEIFEQLRSRKELWLVDRAGHTEAFQKNPDEYVNRVLGFLRAM